jgi:hypothetical protein
LRREAELIRIQELVVAAGALARCNGREDDEDYRRSDTPDWSIEQGKRQFDEQAEGLPKAFIVKALVLVMHRDHLNFLQPRSEQLAHPDRVY